MSHFTGIANPQELAIMAEAFKSYCLEHGIVDKHARTDTAQIVIFLFQGGATSAEELKVELNRWHGL